MAYLLNADDTVDYSQDDGPSTEVVNIRDTILEGSFLPITALLSTAKLSMSEAESIVFDLKQGATLVHYVGHWGNIKALRYFLTLKINLLKQDIFGQTIIHYASRSGKVGLLKFLF
jgi:hypothetical protein